MENSYLNQAHFQSRRADQHLRLRRYEEAIQAHQLCSDLLDEALRHNTTVPLAIESIKLQIRYHLKQRDLIGIKKLQYEKYKNIISDNNTKMQKMTDYDSKHKRTSRKRQENSCQLQDAIYKTITDTDGLLEILSKKGSDTDSLKSLESDLDDLKLNRDDIESTSASSERNDSKKQKNDSDVIKELRTLNKQLHEMIFQLVTQLDDSLHEADTLRDKVEALENEKLHMPSSQEAPPFSTITVRETSRVEEYDDDVISDTTENLEFPALPPLDLPNFDYESFSNQSIEEQLPK